MNGKPMPKRPYRAMDVVTVRAPILPIEAYPAGDRGIATVARLEGTRLPEEAEARAAIAVGSPSLYEGLRGRARDVPDVRDGSDAAGLEGKLLRYLVRASTRPTPFGLFAGVGLARFGDRADVALGEARPTRTRPDAEWLAARLQPLEARLDVRRRLRVIANPAAFVVGGRVVLSKREAVSGPAPEGVSVRASRLVRATLDAARGPIAYVDLVAALRREAPEHPEERIDRLLTQLWEQTILLTELRIAATTEAPAVEALRRLDGVPEADAARAEIEAMLRRCDAWDRLPLADKAASHAALARDGERRETAPGKFGRSNVQVDAALAFEGTTLPRAIGEDAARAAEWLLRMTAATEGPDDVVAFRTAFVAKYGADREVPILELLDPDCGLAYPKHEVDREGRKDAPDRSRALVALACRALAEGRTVVTLTEEELAAFFTTALDDATAPPSLDLQVSVAARSRDALERGEYRLVVANGVGVAGAGRFLGRFAGVVGPAASEAIATLARAEESLAPPALWASLGHAPEHLHSANVMPCPLAADHEIALGAWPSVPDGRVVPVRELVVGIRRGRFYLRWPRRDVDVRVRVGHVLNLAEASPLVRFLAGVGRDGRAQIEPFHWGAAADLPFRPRVEVGRVVLSLARWRLHGATARAELASSDAARFASRFAAWRRAWRVPRHVYLAERDTRLLFDLDDAAHVEEVRRSIQSAPDDSYLFVQEALPGPDDAWLPGPRGRHMSELVVSLVQDRSSGAPIAPPAGPAILPARRDVLRPPGSEWLYLKLYTSRLFEEELVAGPLRKFAEHMIAEGHARAWFFLRYRDPDVHLRLRFRGDPARVTRELLPIACAWASSLIDDGACARFAIDTYDREIERYGGVEGTRLAEALFFADSRAVAATLHVLGALPPGIDRVDLGVWSVGELLASLGLDLDARLAWLRSIARTRAEVGPEFRERRGKLIALLRDPARALGTESAARVAPILATAREARGSVARDLRAAAARGALTRSFETLLASHVHMHVNRLLGTDRDLETKVLSLALRAHEGLRFAPVTSGGTRGAPL